MEGETAEDPTLFPATTGEKLRGARESQGLELSEVAARTRIPQRHLEAIEKSNYSGLPSITYAIGFAKSYARAVGMDEVEIARDLRVELGNAGPERAAPIPAYDLEDPSRVPPRGLAWAGLIVAVLVLAGVALWYGTGLFRGSAPPPETLSLSDANSVGEPVEANSVAAVPAAGGQVTLVATDLVWVRVTDAKSQTLFEKEMIPGERYDVPPDADTPRVRTGGPEKLQVMLNGSNVAPLGPGGQTVDVDVSAKAIQTRGQPGASPTPGASPSASAPRPSVRATPRPSARPTPAPVPAEPVTGNASGT